MIKKTLDNKKNKKADKVKIKREKKKKGGGKDNLKDNLKDNKINIKNKNNININIIKGLLKQNKTLFISLLIVFILLLIVIFFIYYIYYANYKSGLFIDKQGIDKKGINKQGEFYNIKTLEDNNYPVYYLDVGELADNDPTKPIYIEYTKGVSSINNENGISFRTLENGSTLTVKIKSDLLNQSFEGFVFKDAIFEVGFKDILSEVNVLGGVKNLPYMNVYLNYSNINSFNLMNIGGVNDSFWKNESYFLDNNPNQYVRSVNGSFIFKIIYPKEIPGNYSKSIPIDYIKFGFYNWSDFYRLREEDRKKRGFIRKDFNETNTINRNNFSKNYVIYTRNYLEKIYQNTIPKESEIKNSIKSFEIDGNYEPVTFSIYAFEDIYNIDIRSCDLVSNDDKILAENIKISKINYIDKRWYSSYDKLYGLNPWYLSNWDNENIEKNKSQQVWITVYVPKGTKSGKYYGNFNISGRNIENSIVNFELEVYNIKLEEADSESFLYHSPYLKSFSNPKELAAIDMAKHDIKPIIYFSAQTVFNATNYSIFTIDYSDRYKEFDTLKSLNIIQGKTLMTLTQYSSIWQKVCKNSNYFVTPCPEFDRIYKEVLIRYKNEFFINYSTKPSFSFYDEPGVNINGRLISNYLNKLSKEAGYETWVTYYPSCEIPIGGYNLSFKPSNKTSIEKTSAPDWVINDSSLILYYDFKGNYNDSSKNKYNLIAAGNISILQNGVNLNGNNSYAYNKSINIPDDNFTISLWFNLLNDANSSNYNKYILLSDGFIFYQHKANNYFYLYKSNSNYIGFIPEKNKWYHLLCIIRKNKIDECFFNAAKKYIGSSGKINKSTYLYLSYSNEYSFNGSIDDLIILNRTLSREEVYDFIPEIKQYNSKKIEISTNFFDYENFTKIRFSIYDSKQKKIDAGLKKLVINGYDLWVKNELGSSDYVYEVDIKNKIKQGENNISFIFKDNVTQEENLIFYIIDDLWRAKNWSVIKDEDSWTYDYLYDYNGFAGPMDKWLDERVYALSYTMGYNRNISYKLGKHFSYYTTYAAT
ncbi:MAG: LamG-like jellyroll fold domain-containing protein, partial [Candidatus Pacearchaeota archaeon]